MEHPRYSGQKRRGLLIGVELGRGIEDQLARFLYGELLELLFLAEVNEIGFREWEEDVVADFIEVHVASLKNKSPLLLCPTHWRGQCRGGEVWLECSANTEGGQPCPNHRDSLLRRNRTHEIAGDCAKHG